MRFHKKANMALDQIDVDSYETTQKKEMSFLDHLEELRWHIIRAAASVFVFGVVAFMAKDFVFKYIVFAPKSPDFITYSVICKLSNLAGMGDTMCMQPPEFGFVTPIFGELFIQHIKVSFMLGIVASFPYIFWEIWRFISPGLYEKEQKAARGMVAICSSLFLTGVLFGYFVISPFAITFLAGYEIEGVTAMPALASYINYMTMFTLPVGIIFELPIVVFFLSKVGLVTPEFMKSYRRHAAIIILILAAIITPPDVVTQILVGMPLYVLYEISIVISRRVIKKQEKESAD